MKHPDADGLYVEVCLQIDLLRFNLRDALANQYRGRNRPPNRRFWACQLYTDRKDARQRCRCCSTSSKVSFVMASFTLRLCTEVQSETCKHAWSEEFCDGALRE
jgi:hypothetical protein